MAPEENPYLDRNLEIVEARSKLPHWHQVGKMQFVTFRLSDSLPQSALDEIRVRKATFMAAHELPLKDKDREELARIVSQRDEEWLNAGYGSCLLRRTEIAEILRDVMFYGNGNEYDLLDYVIMPNHVHALLLIYEHTNLSKILKSWKGTSSRRIREWCLCNDVDPLIRIWNKESFDRIIRSYEHQKHVHRYIIKNINEGGVMWMGSQITE